MHQLSLLGPPTSREQFEAYHAAHPEVLREMIRLAYEVRTAGHNRCGIDLLLARVRWYFWVERGHPSDEEFKINNNFKPFYARLIMKESPDLGGFFELRAMKNS